MDMFEAGSVVKTILRADLIFGLGPHDTFRSTVHFRNLKIGTILFVLESPVYREGIHKVLTDAGEVLYLFYDIRNNLPGARVFQEIVKDSFS